MWTCVGDSLGGAGLRAVGYAAGYFACDCFEVESELQLRRRSNWIVDLVGRLERKLVNLFLLSIIEESDKLDTEKIILE